MCGIFGYYDRSGQSIDDHLLKTIGEAIYHRGPDDNGFFAAKGAAVGNQRLSIIDLEGGHQPFVSDNGKIIVVQNGEIYNYPELALELKNDGYVCHTKSDTEVILRLYEKYGTGFISRLNGMFAIAILDLNKNSLFIVRDRIGVKPLYIHDDGQRLLFASEIKALLAAGVKPEVNHTALNYFLTYNYVPPPYTIFKDINHLMPGHLTRVDPDKTVTESWWDLASLASEEDRPENEWIEEFNSTLEDAVRIRMRSDVPYGAFLSGGVDSSSVVGCMAKHSNEPVNTFSIGFDDPLYDESPFAASAARLFGTNHVMEIVNPRMLDMWPKVIYHCDQPHGDVSFMPTMKVSELAVKHVKVVLTGDGGDELFAGYDKHRNFFSNPTINELNDNDFANQYRKQLTLFDAEHKRKLFSLELSKEISGHDPWDLTDMIFDKTSHLDRINQALMVDMLLLLPGNNLVKPDRMGMAVSLEARTPFLDYRMMELAFRIPGALKLKDNETKYIFKKAVSPMIGNDLAYRKKQMFTVPVGEWFKNDLLDYVNDLLLSTKAINRGLFETDYIQQMIAEHSRGVSNYTREIRALMAIEIWFQTFID